MSYAYDAFGRRTSKTVSSGTPTQFLYDGANAVQETQGSTVNPILVGLGIDERFARNDTTGRTYFLTDALNSTLALTNSSGAIQNTYSYDPYGNASQSGAGFTNPYQFMAREADAAGLYYYRARYYSPGMGSFISEDPARFYGGQLSFYAGFGGDPIDFNDPYGLWAVSGSVYDGVGGGFQITGSGWGVSSISFSAGVGVGGGFSWDPWAEPKQKDACPASGSNSIGLYASAGVSALGLGGEASAEGGVNLTPAAQFNSYGDADISPSLSRPKAEGEAEASAGVVITHYF
jgi:RHS repeat-associated protein